MVSILMYAEIIVTVMAVLYTLLAFLLQRRFSNMQHIYEIQKQVKEKSNELNAMVKANAPKETLVAKQKEVMALLSESMRHQFKPMIIILPLFIVFWYILLPAMFPPTLTFQLLSLTLPYRMFFILIVFILGFVLSIMVMIRDRRHLNPKEQKNPKEPNNEIANASGTKGV